MVSKFTPGPWRESDVIQLEGRNGQYRKIVDGDDSFGSNIVAFVCVAHPANHDLQAGGAANARLIAAAPDLLDVVRELLKARDQSSNALDFSLLVDAFIAKADLAYTKATGEQP